MATVTFVTSFFYIYNSEYDEKKTTPWRLERFREIVETGIQLCVYVCPAFQKHVEEIAGEFANVKIMRVTTIGELFVAERMNVDLPNNRNETKDTTEYMAVINSKTEFMADAIAQNPWNSEYFAWIDFNISHVFHDKPATLRYLRELGNRQFHGKFFAIPGCWNKFDNVPVENICWRFCGGFFMGDKESILNFDRLYKAHFYDFLITHNKYVWEVNFWAWLEATTDWNPSWYSADHNDSIILNMSASYFSRALSSFDSYKTAQYDYPHIPMYHPGSASYLKFKGEHFLNTRYVNYWYYDSGAYMFYDGLNTIRTINMFSKLTDDEHRFPYNYQQMSEDNIGLQRHPFYARGLEDVRLYEHGGRVRFIATTVEYYHTGGNRMVIGNYDYEMGTYSDAHIVEPPTNTQFEKNWIPLPSDGLDELFIYKWAPFQVGGVAPLRPPTDAEVDINKTNITCEPDNDNKYQLNIISPYTPAGGSDNVATPASPVAPPAIPFFHKMKGSSTFVPNEVDSELIGVIHFSEDAQPRRYYHMLLVLDKQTYRPLRYSEPFVFERPCIEFCIGFDRVGDKHMFWISRFDRDPLLVEINAHIFSFINV
jgi:hypothetical protein